MAAIQPPVPVRGVQDQQGDTVPVARGQVPALELVVVEFGEDAREGRGLAVLVDLRLPAAGCHLADPVASIDHGDPALEGVAGRLAHLVADRLERLPLALPHLEALPAGLSWPMVAVEALNSLVVGALLTFAINLVLTGVRFGGSVAGMQIGFAIVNAYDPQTNSIASLAHAGSLPTSHFSVLLNDGRVAVIGPEYDRQKAIVYSPGGGGFARRAA